MRSLKDFIGAKGPVFRPAALDDKAVFFLFRKVIREEYGLRGEKELTPATFAEGVLSIKANNPLYSNELWIHREVLIERMNRELGEIGIREIRLVRYSPQ